MSWYERIYADQELSHHARAVYMYLHNRAMPRGSAGPV